MALGFTCSAMTDKWLSRRAPAATAATGAPELRSVTVQPLSSTLIHHFQVPVSSSAATTASASASASAKARAVSASSTPPLLVRVLRRQQWKAHAAWLVLALSFALFCLADARQPRDTDSDSDSDRATKRAAAASPAASFASEQLYIVFVSIPVLDKVLPLKNLAEELLHRGYRIGFALPENCRHWVSDLDGLEFISLGNMVPRGRGAYRDVGELQAVGAYESYLSTLRFYSSFQRPMLAALLEDLEDDRPALLVVDRHSFAGLDAAHALALPYVVNNPHLLLDMDAPPAYVPAPFTNYSMHTPSVLERCLNGYYRLQFRLALVRAFGDVNQARADFGLAPVHDKGELLAHQLVLANSAFGLEASRPMAPHFAMVGLLRSRSLLAAVQSNSPVEAGGSGRHSLPAALVSWLEQGGHLKGGRPAIGKPSDLVYISFPPDVPLSPEFVVQLLDALERLEARLLWKVTLQERAAFDLRARPRDSVFFLGEGDLSPGDADAAVLSRVHASVVVTAGNLPTVQEALVSGAPIVGVPFSADQWENVNAVARAGGGLTLDGAQFSAQNVHDSVLRLLHEPAFARAASRLGQIVTAAGGAPRAADAIESVLLPSPRGVGDASFLLPMRNLQPLYKTYLVDVYFVYGVILCGAFVIVRTFLAVVLAVFQPLVDELDLEDLEDDERAALAEAAGANANANAPSIPEHGGRRKTAY